jgi:hypothetical protein
LTDSWEAAKDYEKLSRPEVSICNFKLKLNSKYRTESARLIRRPIRCLWPVAITVIPCDKSFGTSLLTPPSFSHDGSRY